MPNFTFMTGLHRYRCVATTAEEAMAIARRQLNPSPAAEAVIRSTLREEFPAAAEATTALPENAPGTEERDSPDPTSRSLPRGPSRSQSPRPSRGRRQTDRPAGR